MYRNTIQKQLIEEATKMLHHPTAQEIYHYVRERCPNVSQGTVYRGLTFLVNIGKVHQIEIPNGADCFDFNCEQHYHLVCQKCGKVSDTDIPYMKELNDIREKYQYIQTHTLLFYGECPVCYQQGKENKK